MTRPPRPRARTIEKHTDGVVLRLYETGEADMLAVLYTRDEGVIRGIAPSAKKSFRRFGGRLDVLNRLYVTYRRPTARAQSGLATLTDSRLIARPAGLVRNWRMLGQAEAFGQLIGALSPEGEMHRDVYALLLYYLNRLETEALQRNGGPGRPPLTLGMYGLRALGMLGYRPAMDECVVTGEPLAELPPDDLVFAVRRGGVTTRAALRAVQDPVDSEHAPPVSLATVKLIETALTLPVATLDRLKPSAAAGREAFRVLHQFVRYLVGRDFPALAFIERLTR